VQTDLSESEHEEDESVVDGALNPWLAWRYLGRVLRVIEAIWGWRSFPFESGYLGIPSHTGLKLMPHLIVLNVAQKDLDQGIKIIGNNERMHVLDVVLVRLNVCPHFLFREVP
jgi:hypothetical protein